MQGQNKIDGSIERERNWTKKNRLRYRTFGWLDSLVSCLEPEGPLGRSLGEETLPRFLAQPSIWRQPQTSNDLAPLRNNVHEDDLLVLHTRPVKRPMYHQSDKTR
jgi:hypothetical protein